jgi:hypothetical protein
MWYVSGEIPRPIALEMSTAIEFLIMIAEANPTRKHSVRRMAQPPAAKSLMS